MARLAPPIISRVPFMSDSKPDQTPPAADAADAPAPIETAAPADPLQQAEQEKADLKDKLLRALAEMENLRRRTEKDLADARIYGVTRFARDMLDVADNLRRALDSLPEEQRATLEGSLKAMVEGVDLTERDLLKKLETHGVRKQDPMGLKFDPNLHQAMFEAPDESKPNGTVIQVIQSGYTIGDRVLRPAMVGVSKGGPKAAPAVDKSA
jgi:molecular chaperone GrpE